MDAIDDTILRELTADARLPYRELGRRVGLSANAAAARVRRLVDDGTILGFTVVTGPLAADPSGTGPFATRPSGTGSSRTPAARAGLEVFIDVRLAPDASSEAFAELRTSGAFPEILDAVHVTGAFDYLVHAVVRDAAALDRLVRRLKREAGVAQSSTRLAMRQPIGS